MIFILLLHVLFIQILCNNGLQCPENERDALLGFKSGIIDRTGRLSSWFGPDCCKWKGVSCSNTTGTVVGLDLRNPVPPSSAGRPYNRGSLRGKISESLLGLKHLSYLDLSLNYFHRIPIPSFFGSFQELRYLNLSLSAFTGLVPPEIGNLSTLRYLDLHSYPFGYGQYVIDGLWLSSLSSLRYLDMGGLDLSNTGTWLSALSMLPFITEIHLPLCQLGMIPESLPGANFTSLSFLDLRLNSDFNSTMPEYLFGMKSLKHLDVSESGFKGPISPAIGNLTSLEFLDLSARFTRQIPRTVANLCNLRTLILEHVVYNDSLTGFGEVLNGCVKNSLQELDLSSNGIVDRLPDWIGDLKNLRTLVLSSNNLFGPIPESIGRLSSLELLGLSMNGLTGPVSENIGQLSKLTVLDLTYNPLKTTLTEAHFANLKSLRYLDLFNSSLTLDISSDWIAPFQLEISYTRSIRQGPRFPYWLKNQEKIQYLDMSGAGISDSMPDWFWNITSHITELYLSDNQIRGELPRSLNFPTDVPVHIDLSSNFFQGQLPDLPPSIAGLYLSTNSLSGSIPPDIADTTPNLTYLSLSTNNFIGTIPLSLCNLKKLRALDLSRNRLSGKVLDCWDKFPELQYLNLDSNNLDGAFPSSIASVPGLQLLDLSNNSFHGKLPESFESVSMNTLDLSRNNFTGTVPPWITESEPQLRILSLGSNKFVGDIPSQLSNLQSLHILDLSDNKFSGNIPPAFRNISGMKMDPDQKGVLYYDDFSWDGLLLKMWVSTKGRYLEYGKLLSLLTFMDLSSNNLSGRIPEGLSELHGLQSLNVSGNRLTGRIPQSIGELRLLETLDFSRNGLSGAIPSSLSGLNFLSHLNLSYNHLVGRVPSGGQLLSLVDPSIYAGNDGLCGFPLASCASDNASQVLPSGGGEERDHNGWSEWSWLYLGLGLGFASGFWAFCGALLLKREWRFAYFSSVDNILEIIKGLKGK